MFGVQSHPDAEFMGTMIDGMNAITSILDNWRNRVFWKLATMRRSGIVGYTTRGMMPLMPPAA